MTFLKCAHIYLTVAILWVCCMLRYAWGGMGWVSYVNSAEYICEEKVAEKKTFDAKSLTDGNVGDTT